LILPLPIRVRLALWFFLVFAVATLTLGAISLWMVHRSIGELENEELQQRVRGVERFLEIRPADESARSLSLAVTQIYNASHGAKWLQVIDQDGNWIYRSAHIETVFPKLALPQEVDGSERYFTFVEDKLHVRALISTIHVNGRSYTVQTGLTLNRTLTTLGDLRGQLMVLTPLVLLLAGTAGYFVSRKALSPVAAITGEARRIGETNLDKRLPTLNTRDELAHMSETLNQMLDRIEAGNRSVREFTANAAHELRTPVALLRAEAEFALAFERSSHEYRDTIEHIQEETVRMGKLVDDLLTLARADAGVLPVRFEPLNLNEAALRAMGRWKSHLQQSSTLLRISTGANPALIFADGSSIARLIDILIENAWRYSPPGSTVELKILASLEHVELSVIDSGVGISRADQGRIFERFYRASSTRNGSGEGTGLGLALARWIAEAHGAAIEVKSEPGMGSTFRVRFLPLAGAQALEADKANSQQAGKGQPQAAGRPTGRPTVS
jgi:heavy metal sensor kinase